MQQKNEYLFGDTPAPAEASTDIGTDDPDDLSLPIWEVIRTLLLAIVMVATTALIAALV